MTTSAYPAMVAKLLDIFNTAFPVGSGVTVLQGPGATSTGNLKFIHVGLQSVDEFSPPGNAGTGEVTWATMGTGHSRDERYTVNCVARVFAGNDDPATRMTDVFALGGAAIDAVKIDPSLTRVGGTLVVETYTWQHSEATDPNGTWSLFDFAFNFRARI